MVKFTFKGPLVPAFTPFNNDSTKSLNLDIIPKYAQFLAENGLKGVLVNGTTGEGMSQTVQERKILAEKWMEVKKVTNQHMMIQVGGAPLPDVLELAKHAESIGADSILCLPELYFKPTNIEQLTYYLKIVGQAAPNTPLLYYHIPMFTNVNIHMGQFLREVDGKIPTFVGIKCTSEELVEGLEAVNAYNRKFAVFLGADTLMLEAYKRGFDSSIATTFNIFPQLGVKIHEYVFSGRADEAKPLQEKLTKAVAGISKYGSWVQTMKEAMVLFTPFDVGPPRDPIIRLSSAQINNMAENVKILKI
ncbi:dihydrodipicolinate synthase [Holotrichia oblita]|uniref:Dihydrodipicolinate synthase n=1 Tax=Holotrichia oblita TaxID=644536 RepID=A0ACB9TIZ8_HOLOL|nr:dihydrodipicolinate synthase [Holotrichia oblita]